MEPQKTFDSFGDELTTAVAALATFEKDNRKAIEAMVAQHDALERKAEKLEGELTAARVEMDKELRVFHENLERGEAKALKELNGKLDSEKKLFVAGRENNEWTDGEKAEMICYELVGKLPRQLRPLRERNLRVLSLERDLAAARQEAASKAAEPYLLRQRAAREFLDKLVQVAGASLQCGYGLSGFGNSTVFADEVRRIDQRIAIATGSEAANSPVGVSCASANGALELCLQVPESTWAEVFDAWRELKRRQAKRCGISLSTHGVRWICPTPRGRVETKAVTTSETTSGTIPPSSSHKLRAELAKPEREGVSFAVGSRDFY